MTNQMVSRFRVKKLSPKHPLPVYKEYQLPDLSDAANIQRAVPQIETGVEKEEEEEHDLQAAISAAQAAVTTGAKVEKYIPTPDASRLIDEKEYAALYKKKYKDPSTLIRFSSTVEDCIGCPYLMDEEDDAFLQDYNKQYPGEILSEDLFENIMWEFETITNQQWPHLALDPQIPEYEAFLPYVPGYSKLKGFPNLPVVYNHWSQRRRNRAGKSIVPQLKFEESFKNEIDPYVCFRKRETKPVRKTRRTDQQSLERLRRLRSEMEMARNLLEMVLRREKIRKEGLVLEHAVFEKRHTLFEYQRVLGIKEDEDLLPKKKQRISLEGSGATIKIPLHKLRGNVRLDKSPTQIAIEAELARKKEADLPYEDVTESGHQPFPLSIPQQFYQPLSGKTKPMGPKFRKRMGRNGRVFIDRVGFSPTSEHGSGGKTRPGSSDLPSYNRYRFDSDVSDEEDHGDHIEQIDEMDSLYLKHRTQLLSETELRNLVTVPFLTPLNMINLSQARNAATVAMNNIEGRVPSTPINRQPQISPLINSATAIPMKRQSSGRTKMTPQQAAVAMANGMLAANMAAVVNNSPTTGKAAMQIAMATAQQQQQHQQLSNSK
ncbi:enhancer of polycomb-like-domain-containing protein [Gilbertella persicaria]|uniref:enhancer of polycomb-like-domain-containing protein n=1 Tax=Gilbertella persicaria TaxID=101096 RepID=UPI00221E5616|nr:enhancer of polycomb-like-domain-containing protein [Gilbertella persicaria]KAI8097996.1 enhancer of polycomb-like-domain-containing protein [Gilbertella persicaria]